MFKKNNLNKIQNFENNKSFGILFFIVFFLIFIWPLKNSEDLRVWSLVIALIFLFLGLINSKLLTPLKTLWIKLGHFLGYIISPLILSIIYFFVVTPTGLLLRLFRKDILRLKKNNKNTYWENKNSNNSSMKNQF